MDDDDDTDDLATWYEVGRDEAAAGFGPRPPDDPGEREAYLAGWRAGWGGGCVGPPVPDVGE